MKHFLAQHPSIINFIIAFILVVWSIKYPDQITASIIAINLFVGIIQMIREAKDIAQRLRVRTNTLESVIEMQEARIRQLESGFEQEDGQTN